MNGEIFAEKCLNTAGVAIVPGTSFGKSCTDFVRFSYANSYENIEKSLEKIKKLFNIYILWFYIYPKLIKKY